jgi:hypothetical protein
MGTASLESAAGAGGTAGTESVADLEKRICALVAALDKRFPPLHLTPVPASDTKFAVLGDKFLISILPDTSVKHWDYSLLQKLCNSVNKAGADFKIMCAPLDLNHISIYDLAGAEAEFGELCRQLNH